jgi:hypothetical protein
LSDFVLTSRPWALSNDNGLIGVVRLSDDGYLLPGSVTYLKWNNDEGYLELHNLHDEVSVRFVSVIQDMRGRYHM